MGLGNASDDVDESTSGGRADVAAHGPARWLSSVRPADVTMAQRLDIASGLPVTRMGMNGGSGAAQGYDSVRPVPVRESGHERLPPDANAVESPR